MRNGIKSGLRAGLGHTALAALLALTAGTALAESGGHGAAAPDHGVAASDHGASDDQAATEDAAPKGLCVGYGPQTPRDITARRGMNRTAWAPAPPSSDMTLCNIHTHTYAEHKGPGFQVFMGPGEHGGYACNDTASLTPDDLRPAADPHFEAVRPGDSIEVHWVFTSCNVQPGPGLGSCLSDGCANPILRVEAQVFLLVNDPSAANFLDYIYANTQVRGRAQPRSLPSGTGNPVVFAGSTTGTSYTDSVCSPLLVTWSVRPQCKRLDINSLHQWGALRNVFDEHHSHGVRHLVTAPELLSPIE
ncbi:delta-class carbonic anhydrase [Mesobacterium pallidum]|uniref:delta-class carbonic anhydrase n=1 Tax=Mesobacterium pallidum TaxID=2872037 RepID=UPI001EE1BD69|nr:delta-class carbonic anhydrase [Mesobacterium pallidum]